MGNRRRFSEGTERISPIVPADLMRKVRLILLDPATGNIRYRTLSNLITKLLTEWVEKQRRGQDTVSSEIPPADRFEAFTNEGE